MSELIELPQSSLGSQEMDICVMCILFFKCVRQCTNKDIYILYNVIIYFIFIYSQVTTSTSRKSEAGTVVKNISENPHESVSRIWLISRSVILNCLVFNFNYS